ncbi:hypothetical protein SH528x_003634 [Novipirellula sp. SH528]|uniref:hypothetical protein n=1 Tax=Novipirellula sp. SH528 TaxID=3454466 RepID=UPI003FA08B69
MVFRSLHWYSVEPLRHCWAEPSYGILSSKICDRSEVDLVECSVHIQQKRGESTQESECGVTGKTGMCSWWIPSPAQSIVNG